jgi:Lrp/AsnC family leucine-responsive transcriptional regulator
MKLGSEAPELDAIDLQILELLQDQGRVPLVKLGEQVGLSSPSVIDRVKKLEDNGIITGYHASVDARALGKDVTAHPKAVVAFEHTIEMLDDVLECHHVTGEYTLLLKIKTNNTASLERLISTIRSIEGVSRTETMVVLSTHTERATISVAAIEETEVGGNGHGKRHRHGAVKTVVADTKRV